jgi:hypothetical protein
MNSVFVKKAKGTLIVKSLLYLTVLIILLLGTINNLSAETNADSLFVLVFGDSVTMGAWANTELGNPKPGFYLEAILMQIHVSLVEMITGTKLNDLSNPLEYALFLEKYFNYICREHLSAIIGNQSYSIPQKLEDATSRQVDIFSASTLAGCYQTSSILVEKLNDFYINHPAHKAPELIIINFNSMDLIFNTPNEDFLRYVKYFFIEVTNRFPESTIIVTPLMDIVTIMTTSFEKVTIPSKFGSQEVQCADYYEDISFGTILGLVPSASEEEVALIRLKLQTMQEILDNEIDEIKNGTSESYRNYNGKIVKVAGLNPPDNDWQQYLAIDCVHSNIRGHMALSEILWDTIAREFLMQQSGIN